MSPAGGNRSIRSGAAATRREFLPSPSCPYARPYGTILLVVSLQGPLLYMKKTVKIRPFQTILKKRSKNPGAIKGTKMFLYECTMKGTIKETRWSGVSPMVCTFFSVLWKKQGLAEVHAHPFTFFQEETMAKKRALPTICQRETVLYGFEVISPFLAITRGFFPEVGVVPFVSCPPYVVH
jgi:hypothetical protein